jgi:hypothetical protein
MNCRANHSLSCSIVQLYSTFGPMSVCFLRIRQFEPYAHNIYQFDSIRIIELNNTNRISEQKLIKKLYHDHSLFSATVVTDIDSHNNSNDNRQATIERHRIRK